MQGILAGNGTATERAWHNLLVSQASDYWYWDGTEIWDSNVTRGSNLAVAQADQVISNFTGSEATPPTIFLPQRDPYNPGGFEWSAQREPNDFLVWTYAYDVSGLSNVALKWRVDGDGTNPLGSIQNETYVGGPEVGAWNSIPMTSRDVAPPANILTPSYRALQYGAMITGQEDVLIDYYVEATDLRGNVSRSDIQHVYVGTLDNPGGNSVSISPDPAMAGELVTITYDPRGGPLASSPQVYLHYGFDNWATVVSPDPLMNWDASAGAWYLAVPVPNSAAQLDLVFNNGQGTWDNNQGQDWHFDVVDAHPGFEMDGVLDVGAIQVAAGGGRRLFAAIDGTLLYLATDDAGEGQDVFVYMADVPGILRPANWAKMGQVAQWDAYLADENENNFSAWFDASAGARAATGANGGVLEGVIDLAGEFGSLPLQIYAAMGAFQTPDGGALVPALQLPGSLDGNGNLEAAEFLPLLLHLLRTGDFNRDGDYACGDVDRLVAEIVAGTHNRIFDLSGDGLVNVSDLMEWLARAGAKELSSGNPYLPADANLDGRVDGVDFNIWNARRFSSGAGFCGADFNADGLVDGADFGIWNQYKFMTAGRLLSPEDGSPSEPVPEPTTLVLWPLAVGLLARKASEDCPTTICRIMFSRVVRP
jgi:hypothetical protein